MNHPVPKELKGEERLFSIPYLDIHLDKKTTAYCVGASTISGLGLYVNFYLFLFLFVMLNIAVYVLGSMSIEKNKFEAGNVKFDMYLLRKYRYKKNKNVYIRRRGE